MPPKAQKQRIASYIRVRPIETQKANKKNVIACLHPLSESKLAVAQPSSENVKKDLVFSCDSIFWSIPLSQEEYFPKKFSENNNLPFASQKYVYDKCGKGMVEAVMDGVNTCIMTYGQSGTGKTYTMFGSQEDPGMVSQIVQGIYSKINDVKEAEGRGNRVSVSTTLFNVEVSMLEVYMDKVYDLLAKSGGVDGINEAKVDNLQSTRQKSNYSSFHGGVNASEGKGKEVNMSPDESRQNLFGSPTLNLHGAAETTVPEIPLKVRQGQNGGVYVEGLRYDIVYNSEELMSVINKATQFRKVGPSMSHNFSSRSHLIIDIRVTQENALQGQRITGTLRICDLAAVERAERSQMSEKLYKEAMSINLSLSVLRRVLDILQQMQKDSDASKKSSKGSGSGANSQYVPFRESAITHILSDTIGGNSKTIILATVSSLEEDLQDTVNTLRFTSLASAISSRCVKNEESVTATLDFIEKEKSSLAKRLELLKTNTYVHRDEIQSLTLRNEEIKKKIGRLQKKDIAAFSNISRLQERKNVLLEDLDIAEQNLQQQDEYASTITSLKNQLKEQRSILGVVTEKVKEEEKERNSLKLKNDNVSQLLEYHQNQKQNYGQVLNSIKVFEEASSKRASIEEAKINKSALALKKVEDECQALQNKWTALNSSYGPLVKLTEEIEANEERETQLLPQQEELEARFLQENEELQMTLEQLYHELEDARTSADEWLSHQSTEDNSNKLALQGINEEIDSTRSSLKENNENLSLAKKRLTEAIAGFDELYTGLRDQLEELRVLDAQLDSTKATRSLLDQRIQHIESNIEKTKNDITETRNAIISQIPHLKSRLGKQQVISKYNQTIQQLLGSTYRAIRLKCFPDASDLFTDSQLASLIERFST